eukprot:Blabericola_migrator_1__16@NODE_1005_length_5722_cov_152_220336_g691_i0_p6_GENE_NODE_1005_length_5722_cov_152_220336_g691_i0NODE_1005_length_5722_cov_152_220336_g691_i0_p6_ORF_typecomplete_len105_score17_36_NODE_1005_length_5722_cov_152_220336_g691_i023952709
MNCCRHPRVEFSGRKIFDKGSPRMRSLTVSPSSGKSSLLIKGTTAALLAPCNLEPSNVLEGVFAGAPTKEEHSLLRATQPGAIKPAVTNNNVPNAQESKTDMSA